MLNLFKRKKYQEKWLDFETSLRSTVDGLGMPVDEGIFSVVVGLNALGVNTVASCEGHIERGIAGPWIDIQSKIDTSVLEKKAHTLMEKARIAADRNKSLSHKQLSILFNKAHVVYAQAELPHLIEQKKVLSLLTEFYAKRSTPFDERLHLSTWSRTTVRLENQGVAIQPTQTASDKNQKLRAFQKEMNDFGIFLKKKYFKQK